MRRHWITAVSVAINVLLAGVFLYTRPATPPAPMTVDAGTSTSNSDKVKTHVVVRKQFFSWSDVESPDYRIYIARLREVGCPEQTIRDIVVADVNQLYARKKMTEVVTPDQQWWR